LNPGVNFAHIISTQLSGFTEISLFVLAFIDRTSLLSSPGLVMHCDGFAIDGTGPQV
jgi:hypothetical protein